MFTLFIYSSLRHQCCFLGKTAYGVDVGRQRLSLGSRNNNVLLYFAFYDTVGAIRGMGEVLQVLFTTFCSFLFVDVERELILCGSPAI